MKAIITGASGFVGSNLTRRLLQSGHEVVLFTRRQSNFWRIRDITSQLDIRTVDMGNPESLKSVIQGIKPEIIFHLATYGGYPFQQDLTSTVQNNLVYGVNMMMASEGAGIGRFVNFGSSSEYGPKPHPMIETDNTEPTTPYGITKVAQTLFGKYFFKERKLPIVTLRLFSVYGPFEEPGRLIHDIMIALVKNKNLQLSSPTPRRDFVFMDDVIDAIIKSAEEPGIDGEVFNIGSGHDYSVKDAVEISCEIANAKLEILWGIEEKKRSFDLETRWVADIGKAKKLLGWKPKISFHEGLLKTYEWYSDNFNVYE